MADLCNVPRWQQLKATLQNLDYDTFIDQYKSDSNAICMDVRTAEEFKGYHFEGAVNVDYLSKNLADQLEKLDPQKHYYVYCRTGRRSSRVSVILKNMGFKNIFHLKDGIIDRM